MTTSKTAVLLTTVVVLWLGCGVLVYGLVLAHLQRGWPTLAAADAKNNQWTAATFALGGPVSLVGIGVTMAMSSPGYQGFLFRPLSEEEIADLRMR